MSAGPYSIGSDHVPGLSKLVEECGEVAQVAGKVVGFGGLGDHWDGTNLAERLADELADLEAAIIYIKQHNTLPDRGYRVADKLQKFNDWHRQQRPSRLQIARAEGYTEELQRNGRIA
jgi:NTP pyrophosphatase (non-canonical NTP hydrolase)